MIRKMDRTNDRLQALMKKHCRPTGGTVDVQTEGTNWKSHDAYYTDGVTRHTPLTGPHTLHPRLVKQQKEERAPLSASRRGVNLMA